MKREVKRDVQAVLRCLGDKTAEKRGIEKQWPEIKEKSSQGFNYWVWCEERDLNPHAISGTSPSN